jgi:hypothetical protein
MSSYLISLSKCTFVRVKGNLLEEEVGVGITSNPFICLYDFLNLRLDEKVERVNMLFDQAFDFQEGGDQIPFVLDGSANEHDK